MPSFCRWETFIDSFPFLALSFFTQRVWNLGLGHSPPWGMWFSLFAACPGLKLVTPASLPLGGLESATRSWQMPLGLLQMNIMKKYEQLMAQEQGKGRKNCSIQAEVTFSRNFFTVLIKLDSYHQRQGPCHLESDRIVNISIFLSFLELLPLKLSVAVTELWTSSQPCQRAEREGWAAYAPSFLPAEYSSGSPAVTHSRAQPLAASSVDGASSLLWRVGTSRIHHRGPRCVKGKCRHTI